MLVSNGIERISSYYSVNLHAAIFTMMRTGGQEYNLLIGDDGKLSSVITGG